MWGRLSAEDRVRVLGIMFTSIGLGLSIAMAVMTDAPVEVK
jgi:hypothetical protein